MLTRMLVPKPKKAFQSVAVHNMGLRAVIIVPVMSRLPSCKFSYCAPGTETDISVRGLPGMNQTRETSASDRKIRS
jgi:hypothetical protein